MKTITTKNEAAYNELGKFEKRVYDFVSNINPGWMVLLPFITFGMLCLSGWHWYIFPLFLITFFLIEMFCLSRYSKIYTTDYYCDECDKPLRYVGMVVEPYNTEGCYECPECKKQYTF